MSGDPIGGCKKAMGFPGFQGDHIDPVSCDDHADAVRKFAATHCQSAVDPHHSAANDDTIGACYAQHHDAFVALLKPSSPQTPNAADLKKTVSAMMRKYQDGDIAAAADVLDNILIARNLKDGKLRTALWRLVLAKNAPAIISAIKKASAHATESNDKIRVYTGSAVGADHLFPQVNNKTDWINLINQTLKSLDLLPPLLIQ